MPERWGIAFSASGLAGRQWLPFAQGGWSEEGGSLYEAALTVDFGNPPEGARDTPGGSTCRAPTPSTFGADPDD